MLRIIPGNKPSLSSLWYNFWWSSEPVELAGVRGASLEHSSVSRPLEFLTLSLAPISPESTARDCPSGTFWDVTWLPAHRLCSRIWCASSGGWFDSPSLFSSPTSSASDKALVISVLDSCHYLLPLPARSRAHPAGLSVSLLCRHRYYYIFIFKTSVLNSCAVWGHSSPWSPFLIPVRFRCSLPFAQSAFGLELSTVLWQSDLRSL